MGFRRLVSNSAFFSLVLSCTVRPDPPKTVNGGNKETAGKENSPLENAEASAPSPAYPANPSPAAPSPPKNMDPKPVETPTPEPYNPNPEPMAPERPKLGVKTGFPYSIGANGATRNCLSFAGLLDSPTFHVWTCNGLDNQRFQLEVSGSKYFAIAHSPSKKCLEAGDVKSPAITSLRLGTCNQGPAQQFEVMEKAQGEFRFVHPQSNKCLSVDHGNDADGTSIRLFGCDEKLAAQSWKAFNEERTLKIMPLGASITQGVGSKLSGYRGVLHRLLNEKKVRHQFIGSSKAQPADLPADQQSHEGHPGSVITSGTSGRAGTTDNLQKWLGPSVNPDYILILVGSNDVDLNYKFAEVGDRYSNLISIIADKKTGLKPNAQVLVATLPRINNPETEARNVIFNKTIKDVVAKHRAAGENVSVVDVHAAVKPEDKTDNLHPNDSGYEKIGALWFQAMSGL